MRRFARRQAGKVVLVGFGLLLGASGAAFATGQVFGTNGELNGCAHAETGDLRLDTPDHPCRSPEEAVSWNIQGPPGPRGEKGEPGSTVAATLDALAGTPCAFRGRAGTVVLQPAHVGFQVNVNCLTTDDDEPNDSRETARVLSPVQLMLFATPSIYPAGDHDWYALNNARVSMWFINNLLGGALEVELYRDGVLVASGTAAGTTPFSFPNPSNGTPSDWLLHVSGSTTTAYGLSMMANMSPPMP